MRTGGGQACAFVARGAVCTGGQLHTWCGEGVAEFAVESRSCAAYISRRTPSFSFRNPVARALSSFLPVHAHINPSSRSSAAPAAKRARTEATNLAMGMDLGMGMDDGGAGQGDGRRR